MEHKIAERWFGSEYPAVQFTVGWLLGRNKTVDRQVCLPEEIPNHICHPEARTAWDGLKPGTKKFISVVSRFQIAAFTSLRRSELEAMRAQEPLQQELLDRLAITEHSLWLQARGLCVDLELCEIGPRESDLPWDQITDGHKKASYDQVEGWRAVLRALPSEQWNYLISHTT